jgi:hypothetical protein
MSTTTMNAPATANPFAGKATKAGGTYDLCPAGNHPAHLVAIIDLGTHDSEYEGKKKEDRKFFLAWELSGKMKPNGKPFVIGREYTVLVEPNGSFSFAAESNLRKMMEGWRGKKYESDEEIDITKLLGRPCLVNVAHKGSGEKTYANIAGISGTINGMQIPTRHHDTVAYHVSMGEPPDLLWMPRSYGEILVDIIKRSKEFTGQPISKNKGKPKDTAYSAASTPAPAPAASTPPVEATADDDILF